MRFPFVWILVLFASISLSACWLDAPANQPSQYDGAWSVSYSPTVTAGTTCSGTASTVTLSFGNGSATQNLTCSTITNNTTLSQTATYTISIAVSSQGGVNALVNGIPHTGNCISTLGCYASATQGNLSLLR